MPFVPRSQIEQQRTNAPMSVVENADNQRQTEEPVADNANVEEQINELNELLAHVLDEISSLKSAIYDKARTEKVRNPKKKIRSRDDDSDDSDDQHRRGGREAGKTRESYCSRPAPDTDEERHRLFRMLLVFWCRGRTPPPSPISSPKIGPAPPPHFRSERNDGFQQKIMLLTFS